MVGGAFGLEVDAVVLVVGDVVVEEGVGLSVVVTVVSV